MKKSIPMKKINIAVDGYSSCGKSTLAKALAARLGYVYIDTGAMYRAVTFYCLEKNLSGEDEIISQLDKINVSFRHNTESGKSETYLNGKNIERAIRENTAVAENVSKISSIREVRKKLVSLQKELGKQKGIVMDGRDIGTVVFPDAELKLFMTADTEIRAKRRYDELLSKGIKISMEEVKKNIESRDYQDTHRREDPLRKAEDAVVIDNSFLDPGQQFEIALKLAEEKIRT